VRQEAPTLVEGEIPVQTDSTAPPPEVADGAGRRAQARRPGRARRRWLVPVIIVLVLVVLVAGGVWAFTRTQWYVAEDEGRVALFHGVRSRPLGIPLSSVERTYFPTTCLQPVDETRVRSGYIADSRSDAVRFIDTLRRLPSSTDTGPRVPPDGRLPQPQPNPPAAVTAADCFAAGGS
jgi:protein phosphatase